METAKKISQSKVSVVGLFAFLSIVLTVPLVVLLSQERQETRSKAAEPTPSIVTNTHQQGRLSGYIFVDANQNSQRDTEEKPLAGVTVVITQFRGSATQTDSTNDVKVTSDSNGYFVYTTPQTTGEQPTYLVKVVLPDGYKTMNTNPLMLSDMQGNSQKIIEFGLYPLVAPTAGPSCTPRPACLNSVPKCLIPEPAAGWCPDTAATVSPTLSTKPSPSVSPRPSSSVYRTPTETTKPLVTGTSTRYGD